MMPLLKGGWGRKRKRKENTTNTLTPSLGSINRNSVHSMGSNIFDVLNTSEITVGILCSVQDTIILGKALTNWSARSLEIMSQTEEVGLCSLEKRRLMRTKTPVPNYLQGCHLKKSGHTFV